MLWARDFLTRGYKRGLDQLITHAQSCPLTLDLQLPREVPDMRRMLELLPRTKSLLRSGSLQAITLILQVLQHNQFPLLEEVTLSCHEQNATSILENSDLSKHPSLRTLTLNGCILPIPDHVTSLFITLRGRERASHATYMSQLLDTLAHTPRLRSLTVHLHEFVDFGIARFGGLPEHTTHLPALTELVLDDPSDRTGGAVVAFLNHINAPSLTRVRVTEAYRYAQLDRDSSTQRQGVMRELQDLLSYFKWTACIRNPTFLAVESCMVHPTGYKGIWPDAHMLSVRIESHVPQTSSLVSAEDPRSLSIHLCCKGNPRQAFPATIPHALGTANVSLQHIKVLDVDLSWFGELSTSIETLLRQCSNVEKIIIGHKSAHESTHEVFQALTQYTLGDADHFRQLPFHIDQEILLPRLRTIELPNANVNRTHFLELLYARFRCGVPLHCFIIPGENHDSQAGMSKKSMPAALIRDNVVGRFRSFATGIGAKLVAKDTSPRGKPGTCPMEIIFNFPVTLNDT